MKNGFSLGEKVNFAEKHDFTDALIGKNNQIQEHLTTPGFVVLVLVLPPISIWIYVKTSILALDACYQHVLSQTIHATYQSS